MMKTVLLCISLVIAVQQIEGIKSSYDKLIDNLTKDYNENAQPKNAAVKIGMAMLCTRFNENTNVLTTKVWEKFLWTDERLMWKSSDYEGINKITVPAKLVWTPDMKLINAFEKSEERDEMNVFLKNNGTLIWVMPTMYKTLCKMNKDHQSAHCRIRLGSWSHDHMTMPLTMLKEGFDTNNYMDECTHTISNIKKTITSTKYMCCLEPFDSLEITFDVMKKNDEEMIHNPNTVDEEMNPKAPCRWPGC